MDELVETCNLLMQNPSVVDESAYDSQKKANATKIDAINRLMDEISLLHDPTSEIRLSDIERIQQDNLGHDSVNFKVKFGLDYMKGANADAIVKSRKKANKGGLVAGTIGKQDHQKFMRKIEKSFTGMEDV